MSSNNSFHWPKKKNIFGVDVSVTTYQEAVDAIIGAAQAGRSGVATFLAVHGIVSAATDPEYRRRVNACQMVGPDGQPVRWAAEFLSQSRIEGPSLWAGDDAAGVRAMRGIGIECIFLRQHAAGFGAAGFKPSEYVSGIEDRRRGITPLPPAFRG